MHKVTHPPRHRESHIACRAAGYQFSTAVIPGMAVAAEPRKCNSVCSFTVQKISCVLWIFVFSSRVKWNEMIGVLSHDSALQGYTWPGTTWAMRWILLWIMPLVQARSTTCWPAVQRATTVPRLPPSSSEMCVCFRLQCIYICMFGYNVNMCSNTLKVKIFSHSEI